MIVSNPKVVGFITNLFKKNILTNMKRMMYMKHLNINS